MRNTLFPILSVSFVVACSGDPAVGPGQTQEDDAGSGVADSGRDANAPATDSGSTKDAAVVSTTCEQGPLQLTAGASVTIQAQKNGNQQRDYCFVVPSSAKEIHIDMSGGSCAPYSCMGSDVHLFLKQGEVPDAFSPDSTTKTWSFGPGSGSTATFVKSVSKSGAWYLSLRDDANTLGYKSVSMKVSFL